MQALKSCSQARGFLKFIKYNACFARCDFSSGHVVVEKCKCPVQNSVRLGVPKVSFLSSSAPHTELVDGVTFEKACQETLESLCDYFEELVEDSDQFKSADISYSDGVLTVNLGPQSGIYVINRQSPNRQIWLSSPKSGPKRYDFVVGENCWVYKHDGVTLHRLLQDEISKIAVSSVDFGSCAYCKL